MEIAKIEVGRTTGVCTRRGRIPAGIVGASVQVSFTDPVWDKLIKTVVFRGKGTRIAEFDGSVAIIPHEVVAEPGTALFFGIFGHDSKTDLQIPLIEVRLGTTEAATDANADPGTDPTLPIWAQLKEDVADLAERVDNMTPGGPGGDVDLDGYATEQWVKDQGYLTDVPDGYAKTSEIPKKAEDIGALPSTYTPPNQTAEQVGADPKGTAASAVSEHNTSDDAHADLRLAIKELSDRINAVLDSDDTTLDELSEIVAYIKSNKTLINAITTSKVSITDIINNLTTNVANKPLSAAQGVVLAGLIKEVRNLVPSDDHINSLIDNKLDSGGNAVPPLIGGTDEITPAQAFQAYMTGQPLRIVHIAGDEQIVFSNFNVIYDNDSAAIFSTAVGLEGAQDQSHCIVMMLFGSDIGSTWNVMSQQLPAMSDIRTHVVQDTPPEDTSVLWVDPTDNSDDGFQDVVDDVLTQIKASMITEEWTFELEDGSTVTKAVYIK